LPRDELTVRRAALSAGSDLVSTATMGHEANLKVEDGMRRRRDRQKIIAVLVILILSVLAFYGFENISKTRSYNEIVRVKTGSLREGDKMQVNSIVEEQNSAAGRRRRGGS
jgi:hypothetical protein